MVKQLNSTKVVTSPVRLSYANLLEPKSVGGGTPKYGVSLIIPKSDTKLIETINNAIEAAIQEGVSKFGGKVPNRNTLKLPLRDGDADRPDDPAYANSYFINANSLTPPEIVDKGLNSILDRSEIYSGMFARVSINFYAFNSNGNRGIACGLGNVQKTKDGEPLSGRTSAADDFGSDYEEDDFLK